MSITKVTDLINGLNKSGEINIADLNYILRKASEMGVSQTLVKSMVEAKNIKVINLELNKPSEEVYSNINKEIRIKFEELTRTNNLKLIAEYFIEKLFDTYDTVLINYYLNSLLDLGDFKKAYEYVNIIRKKKLQEDFDLSFTIGKVLEFNDFHKSAFESYFDLHNNNNLNLDTVIDRIVAKFFAKKDFDNLYVIRKWKNYNSIAKEQANIFFESKDYNSYIQIFELEFENDFDLVKNYIWSLYKNNDTEKKAYEKGTYYISKIAKPETLSYIMGLTCSYLEKWIEAYDFFKNCLSRNIDVQENIDKVIDKLVSKNEWQILAHFKDSLNYKTKIEQAFTSLDESKNYKEKIVFFEIIFLETTDKSKITKYVHALSICNVVKALVKYKEFDNLFTSNEKYWIWLGGWIYEHNSEFEFALNLFKKADSIDVGYSSDDIKRVNYILHPEVHFKDLYDEKKYSDAIEIFESKLKKSTDINLIVLYVSSLYKNKGTEEKGLELGLLYSNINPEGDKLFQTIALIYKYLKKYLQSKEYFTKAKLAGFNVDEELQEINIIIAKEEEEERKRKEEEERKRKEDLERKRIEEQKRREVAEKRRQQKEDELKSIEKQRKKEEEERKQQEIEEEKRLKEEQEKQDELNSKVGSHEFKSSITRGGDAIFPEHIYVDDNELTWVKKTGVFSKDSKTIPMKNITQIDIET